MASTETNINFPPITKNTVIRKQEDRFFKKKFNSSNALEDREINEV